MLYGQWLNRLDAGLVPVLLTNKPLSNFVEATITWETRGVLVVPTQNGSPASGINLEQTQPGEAAFFPPTP
jgi:hypothetical protein